MNDTNKDIAALMDGIGQRARAASRALARSTAAARSAALDAAAEAILSHSDEILNANQLDMQAAEAKGVSGSMLDRLLLDESRINAMAAGIRTVAALDDPDIVFKFSLSSALSIRSAGASSLIIMFLIVCAKLAVAIGNNANCSRSSRASHMSFFSSAMTTRLETISSK